MAMSLEEQKRKGEKFKLKAIFVKFNISIDIRAISRECCLIMGGKSNKLWDQKGQDPKRVRQAKKSTKSNPAAGQNDHLKCT